MSGLSVDSAMARLHEVSEEQRGALHEALLKIASVMQRSSEFKLYDFLVSGPMVNEVGVEWEQPLLELHGNNVVAHERMRFI